MLPGEQPLPRQPAGANGHGPLVLLVGNVRQRGVIGGEHGQDALELVALQNAGPQCQQRRAADHTRRQAARHQPVGQPARVEHDQPDAQKHQRRAVVTLHMNGRRRQRNVHKSSSRFLGRFTCPRTWLKCSASVKIKLIFASSAGWKVMPPTRYQL